MRPIILLSIVIGLISCDSKNKKAAIAAIEKIPDNPELVALYDNDQADRKTATIDWSVVSKRDRMREARIYELLDSNKVKSAGDYYRAAMIFQHGQDSIAYGMAVKLMRKSLALDSTGNKWLLAAAIDRDLLSRNKPQIYGTQYGRDNGDEPWRLQDMDTSQVSDAERIEYGVRTLAQQQERVKQMNSLKINDLIAKGKTTKEIVAFIQQEDIATSKYDLSEMALNIYGYQLMNAEKIDEALAIFKLNTERYPEGFNTFDSYGEALLKIGDKEAAVAAYRKSLVLNPDNENAKQVLLEIE